jgi:autotransporter-associated beta strand protein
MLSASTVFGTGGGDSIWEMQAYGAASGAGTYSIGSLSGVAGTTVDLMGIGSTLKAGSDNSDTTFAGSMLGGSADSFLKEGTGMLTWVGSTNYQVAPTIAGGILKADLSANSGALTLPGSTIAVQADGTLNLHSGTDTGADSTFFNQGTITGNGTITKTGVGYIGFILNGTSGVNGFTGLIDVQEGTLANNGSAWGSGAGLMDMNIASGAQFDLRTQNVKIDALSGAGLIARSWTGTATLSVGNNDGSGDFSGTIQNLRPEDSNGGVLAFTKTGGGTQTLSGSCTYTGATTVSGGTLNLNVSEGFVSAVTVQTGATLSGSGAVDGSVTVQSGGTLAGTAALTGPSSILAGGFLKPAGQGTIGTITVDDTLSIAGNLQVDIHKSGATLTNDQIVGLGSVTATGTLTVTATGDTLALNNVFQIFNVTGGVSGTFSAPPVLPELPDGLSWDISKLLIDGTIKVSNFVGSPIFTPPAGGYAGTPALTITSDSGSTIYYTLDGSTPTHLSTSGASPLNIGSLPANTENYTVTAIASKSGQLDSLPVVAIYNTIDTPLGMWMMTGSGLNPPIG